MSVPVLMLLLRYLYSHRDEDMSRAFESLLINSSSGKDVGLLFWRDDSFVKEVKCKVGVISMEESGDRGTNTYDEYTNLTALSLLNWFVFLLLSSYFNHLLRSTQKLMDFFEKKGFSFVLKLFLSFILFSYRIGILL